MHAFPLSHRLPRRIAPVLFTFLMSTSLSAAITVVNTGIAPGLVGRWLAAYGMAWSLAFPLVTLLAPRAGRLVDALTD